MGGLVLIVETTLWWRLIALPNRHQAGISFGEQSALPSLPSPSAAELRLLPAHVDLSAANGLDPAGCEAP